MNYVKLYIVLCMNAFLFVKAQVVFDPDPEGDVQLQITPLTPNVNVTTAQCYSDSPDFKVQYVSTDDEKVYGIEIKGNLSYEGSPVNEKPCNHSQSQFRVQLATLRFIADHVLVGKTFRLKATLDNHEGNSTLSQRTYTFPAPFNLTGSSVNGVLHFNFTWTCHVTSDHPTIEWVRGGTNLRQSGIRNGSCVTYGKNDSYIYNCQQSQSTYTLTIPGPNLTEELQDSTWRCKNASYETKGSKFMMLDIAYPPRVSLYLQNTTENMRNHTVNCTAVGRPNNATIVALQHRVGETFIRNITNFTLSSPGNMTWNIPRVSYQDMGTYTCLASNGIPDRSNERIQSDMGYLNVNTSAKFEMLQYVVRFDIGTPVSLSIPFYVNPAAGTSDVVWINNTGSSDVTLSSSVDVSLFLRDADVKQTFYDVDVTLRGQSAVMNITSFENYYGGNYTLKVKNNQEVAIVLMCTDPPETPSNFQLLTRKETSIVVTWNKGSDGGHPQTFVILYKEQKSDIYKREELDDTTTEINVSYEIKGLKTDANYVFILYSFNKVGNSTGYQIFDERTLTAPVTSTPSSLNAGIVGGAAGGGAAVLVVIIVTMVVILKRRRTKDQGTESKSEEMLAGSKRHNIDDNDGRDGLKHNPVYGGYQGGANAVQGASAAPENQSPYAEIGKPEKKGPAKTSEEAPHIHAEVNKQKKTNGKGKQKKQKAKVKAEGDKYQNVDGLKQNCSTDNQKATETEQRGYRNKDGLFYMDVKFDQPPTRGKPTIRKEESTGYAMIQFEEPNAKSTSSNVRGAEGGR